ncbi:MAG TPA: hypothetical protein VMH80_17355 [Bryobacteraceae bacterium]|nr:hypothetical protein [Bryobacteraceae bacterium]
MSALLCGSAALADNALTVSPTSISLKYVIGTDKAPKQTVHVGTTGASSAAVVSLINEGTPANFLNVTPVGCQATPCDFTVAAASDAAAQRVLDKLTPGVQYTASFQFIGSAGVPNSPVVNVTLAVEAAPSPMIQLSPTSASLVAPVCSATPSAHTAPGNAPTREPVAHDTPTIPIAPLCYQASVPITVKSIDGHSHTFTVTLSSPDLSVDQPSGTVSGTDESVVHVWWNDQGEKPGPSTGAVTFVSDTGATTSVSLIKNVTDEAILELSEPSLTFHYQDGGLLPAPQYLSLDVIGPATSYTSTIVEGTSNPCPKGLVLFTPDTGSLESGHVNIVVALDGTVSVTGPCTNILQVSASNAFNPVLTALVSVNVSSQPALVYRTARGYFSGPEGSVTIPATGTINVSIEASDASNVPISLGNIPSWASAKLSGTVTPAVLTLSSSPALDTNGSFAGDLKITSTGASNSPLDMPVDMTVGQGQGGDFSAFPPASFFDIFVDVSTPQHQDLRISGPAGTYDVATGPPFSAPTAVTLPNTGFAVVPVTVTPGGLPGTTVGALSLLVPGISSTVLSVPITANVTPHNLVIEDEAQPVEPDLCTCTSCSCPVESSLMFFRDSFTPADPEFSVSATTLGGTANVLSVSPGTLNLLEGGTPSAILRQINPGTPPGTYVGTVNLTLSGSTSPIEFPWVARIPSSTRKSSLDVRALPLYSQRTSSSATTQVTRFHHDSADSGVPSATVSLGGSGQSYAAIGPDWVTVTPATGTTPQTLTVAANPTALSVLSPGSYAGAIVIAVSSDPYTWTIPVNLVIGAAPSVAVVNAASGHLGSVSPGEIVSIFGANIGPSTPAGLTLTPAGTVSTTLNNTQVLFDGVAAALTYAGSGQINAIVPYEVGGRHFTSVTVRSSGAETGATVLAVADSAPGIFAAQGGTGQGAILNQDNSYNAASNPAAAGSTITIYATGEGPLTPSVPTGSVTSSTGPTFPAPVAPVSVTIAGKAAVTTYAGEAPGFASGVFQLDVTIPAGTAAGAQQVVVTVGNNANAAQNVTVAVK